MELKNIVTVLEKNMCSEFEPIGFHDKQEKLVSLWRALKNFSRYLYNRYIINSKRGQSLSNWCLKISPFVEKTPTGTYIANRRNDPIFSLKIILMDGLQNPAQSAKEPPFTIIFS